MDRVKSKEVNIKYCPTDLMDGGFFTKPLSGDKFKVFRRAILNLVDNNQQAVGA